MGTQKDNPLLLQQGDKLYLLLGTEGTYHLFSVDKRFTAERENRLMQMYRTGSS